MARLGIVDAHPIDENERLLERSPANGEIGLYAFDGARLNVDGGIGAANSTTKVGDANSSSATTVNVCCNLPVSGWPGLSAPSHTSGRRG